MKRLKPGNEISCKEVERSISAGSNFLEEKDSFSCTGKRLTMTPRVFLVSHNIQSEEFCINTIIIPLF